MKIIDSSRKAIASFLLGINLKCISAKMPEDTVKCSINTEHFLLLFDSLDLSKESASRTSSEYSKTQTFL